MVPSTVPASEHLVLLRALACCHPGKGYVVGNPGPATLQTFRACVAHGWVESVSLGPVQVWKMTRTGRAAYVLALTLQSMPAVSAEC